MHISNTFITQKDRENAINKELKKEKIEFIGI